MKALLISTTAPDSSSSLQTGSTNWTLKLTRLISSMQDVVLVTSPPVKDTWLVNSNMTIVEHQVDQEMQMLHRFFKSFIYGIYPSIWTLYSSTLARYLRGITPGKFDVCWLLDDYAGIYLKYIPAFLPTIFVRHYLFSTQFKVKSNVKSFSDMLKSYYHKSTACSFDRWTTSKATIVILGTKDSVDYLKERVPEQSIEYLPTKPAQLPPPTTPNRIRESIRKDNRLIAIFLADMSFIRNAEGAKWFINEVISLMPDSILERYHFKFVGKKPEGMQDMHSLPDVASVEFTGFVSNLVQTLHEAQIAFIPVFGGNGVRLKTLTLLGTGLPTVSTTDALEGLDMIAGKDVLIANQPTEYIFSFEKLLSENYRLQLHENILKSIGAYLSEKEDAEYALSLSARAASHCHN